MAGVRDLVVVKGPLDKASATHVAYDIAQELLDVKIGVMVAGNS